MKFRLSKLERKAKMSVNKSIPRCKENPQTTAPTDDNDDNALAYYTGTGRVKKTDALSNTVYSHHRYWISINSES